jgi:hypothetical protein
MHKRIPMSYRPTGIMFRGFRISAVFNGVLMLSSVAIAQPNTVPSKVAITPEHVLSINGRKVFPIGFTLIPPPDAKTPNGKPAFEEMRSAGALFLRTGPMRDIEEGKKFAAWDKDWAEREKQYMKAAARAGMYCAPWLKELAEIDGKHPEREQSLRKVVRFFKNYPGLGVWKGADEPQWGKRPVPALVKAYKIIHEEDPNHPVWIVHAPRGTVQQLRTYNTTFDIGGVDIYPVSDPPGRHLAATDKNREISAVGDYTQKMLNVVDSRKPIWLTLQIAFSGVVPPKRPLVFPTLRQQRFMTYEAIINGANGLVYFGGNLQPTLNDRDRALGWNWTYWDSVLRSVVMEVGDKGPLAEALCVANSKLPVKATGNDIELAVREVGRDIFILACCRDPKKTAQMNFTGLPEDLTDGEVLFESGRKIVAKGGSFSDSFSPFDVHVYKFRH